MAKLYARLACMGSGKSLDLMKSAFNYKERGMDVYVAKPRVDTREGVDKCIIASRVGLTMAANWIDKYENIFVTIHREVEINKRKIACVFVDEFHFLSSQQIDQLSDVVDILNIPVICYGLRTDFKTHLFDGTKRLLEICDDIELIRNVDFDGRRTIFNARIIDNHIIKEGEQVMIGGNESYIAVTRKNYKMDRLK